jgi:hypothetical protein
MSSMLSAPAIIPAASRELQVGVHPAPVADPDMLVHQSSQNAQRRGAECLAT